MTQSPVAVQRIIWMALILGVVTYIGLGLSGILAEPAADPPPRRSLQWVFAGVALTLAVIAGLFHARAAAGPPPGSAPAGEDPATRPPFRIVGWALQEAIAVLGFVLMILGYRSFEWLPFCLAALALLLMHGPRAETV